MPPPDIENPTQGTKEHDFSKNTTKQLHHDAPLNPAPSNAPSSIAPPPAPNGGLKAWSQPLAAHLVIINCWGYISSFGFFQSYYTNEFQVEPSAISWIGSVQILLIYFVGTFSGRALDAGYFRVVVGAGFVLQVLGVFATSGATAYWQLFLAQGICKGLGDGLVFCPTVALVATYFTTKRSLAIGVMASGGATGGIIFPLIAQQLLPRVGFGWTVRTMGFVILFDALVFLSVARPRLPPRKVGPIVEWSAFNDPAFSLFCCGMFMVLWAVFFTYFYISSFGRDILHVDPSTSLNLLLVLNAIGVPARILCNLIADKIGPVNTLIPAVLAAGALIFGWIAIKTLPSLYVFCVIYGFFGGGIQSLFPAACASLTTDLKKMGVRTGMCFSFVSVACLTGPPIAGALIQRDDGGYMYAQIFGGVALFGGTATLMAAKFVRSREVMARI
ncbi:MFS general substrate transporter [Karstenula rhodostoma CBS 690.94]|uniref:MFS general substrate transporter n=1 Tax=Karstenula rhodostoma CBS 690.94 TaxID=1392251 RepID=A0A9P4U683_9PLEO|nr:MFS general substrate transporter [Karstenula rhodostoma CBS 690.94]